MKSPFHGFRFHDLRHQAITELAESKASDGTIMGIAGHVSKKMLQHYSHVRLEAKRSALDALSMKPVKRAIRGAQRKVTTQTTTQNCGGRWKGCRKLLNLWWS